VQTVLLLEPAQVLVGSGLVLLGLIEGRGVVRSSIFAAVALRSSCSLARLTSQLSRRSRASATKCAQISDSVTSSEALKVLG